MLSLGVSSFFFREGTVEKIGCCQGQLESARLSPSGQLSGGTPGTALRRLASDTRQAKREGRRAKKEVDDKIEKNLVKAQLSSGFVNIVNA